MHMCDIALLLHRMHSCVRGQGRNWLSTLVRHSIVPSTVPISAVAYVVESKNGVFCLGGMQGLCLPGILRALFALLGCCELLYIILTVLHCGSVSCRGVTAYVLLAEWAL